MIGTFFYHVTARLVDYSELSNSGVCIPDEGMAVSDSMQGALEMMPTSTIHEGTQDYIIAWCQSRKSGIKFDQEGLAKMVLCIISSPAQDLKAYFEAIFKGPTIMLTLIERAVVEMV